MTPAERDFWYSDAPDASDYPDVSGGGVPYAPRRESLWPCCSHCIDGDGMLPCGQFHDEPCAEGECGLVTDAEIAEWREGLTL